MIDTMWVQNFGCVKDVRVSLSPLHAFIGPNDSGKSSVLQAARTIAALARCFDVADISSDARFQKGTTIGVGNPIGSYIASFDQDAGLNDSWDSNPNKFTQRQWKSRAWNRRSEWAEHSDDSRE
ncbi:MAG: AAA family ATPase, partial [Proteobacteria bacterium]|nr:AAA family ATPase [Pseudomonadota bacterium]